MEKPLPGPGRLKRENAMGLSLRQLPQSSRSQEQANHEQIGKQRVGATQESNPYNEQVEAPEAAAPRVDKQRIDVDFRLDLKEQDLVVLEEIRSGGNGAVVSKVQHRSTGLVMAQKVIRVERIIRRRVVQELQVMHDCCASEYIVDFYGAFGNGEGGIVFCMEYMELGSLDIISSKFGPIHIDILGKIAEAVLGGLTYLYTSHRIMHRDVKPSNILVNLSGQIKISDFQASKQLDSSIAETFVGGGYYMAPERIFGEPYTVRSDVWSVGITLIELATASYPYTASDDSDSMVIMDLLQRIVHDPSPQLPESDAFIPILHDMISKCLMKDPKKRPTPKQLYDSDDFILASRRTPVNLGSWAAWLTDRNWSEFKRFAVSFFVSLSLARVFSDSYPVLTILTPINIAPSHLPAGLALTFADVNGNKQKATQENEEPDEGLIKLSGEVKSFLESLQSLTSMTSLDEFYSLRSSNHTAKESRSRVPGFCSSCMDALLMESVRRGESKEEIVVEETNGRRTAGCPLCRLKIDWLSSAHGLRIPGVLTMPLPWAQSGPRTAANAYLKVGRLDDFMAQIIKIGEVKEDPNTGSGCAFQMAAAWMTICLTKHKRCIQAARLTSSVLPKRVIDVGPPNGSEEPRLHIGGTEAGLYFALSYRWGEGTATDFQTTMSNLDTYKNSIALSALPQTKQDVICITRKLGVRYIWIDALCIIQDSEDDWRAEAKEMASIYKNALLTIAAAADPVEGNHGCFRDRSRLQTRPIDSSTTWPDGSAKYIFADRRATRDGARPPGALDTRAWVLQEQVLSTRVLSYSNHELYWDCICQNASETFPDGIPFFYDADMRLPDIGVLKEAIIGGSKTTISRKRFYTSWRKIVEEYSRRHMTKGTDRLAALLGLAAEASHFLEDTLQVGLWENKMWRELLWWVEEPKSAVRPHTFHAPTWSWASISDPISVELLGHDSEDDLSPCVEILYVEAESNQTLSVLSGEIIVRGKLIALPPETGVRWRGDIQGIDHSFVECLIIAVSKYHVYGLSLVALHGQRHYYERIGMVSWRSMSGASVRNAAEEEEEAGNLRTISIV